MYDESVDNKIMELAEKYKEIEYEVPRRLRDKLATLPNMAFIIITPDSIKRGITKDIIEYLGEGLHVKFCAAKVKTLTSRDIEILYKYSFKRKILEGQPSYWWLMDECLQIGPSMGLILYSDDFKGKFFSNEMVKLKGEYGKNNKESLTIRGKFQSFSRLLNVMHCSDDIFNVLRESSIFFNEEEMEKIMVQCQNKKFYAPSVISSLVEGSESKPENLVEVKNNIVTRIHAINTINGKDVVKINDARLMNLSFKDFKIEIQGYGSEIDGQCLSSMYLLYILNGRENVNMDIVEYCIKNSNICLNDFEKVIIKNISTFKKWTQYEVYEHEE